MMIPVLTLVGGNALPINNYYKMVEAYQQGHPRQALVHSICQRDREGNPLYLEIKAAHRFREMMAEAAHDGFHLRVISAFRTHHQQKQLKRKRGKLAASAGWSTHQQGLSVDIAGTTRTIKGKKHRTILYWWLVRNASRYGFYNDVPHEPWHWTFERKERENG